MLVKNARRMYASPTHDDGDLRCRGYHQRSDAMESLDNSVQDRHQILGALGRSSRLLLLLCTRPENRAMVHSVT